MKFKLWLLIITTAQTFFLRKLCEGRVISAPKQESLSLAEPMRQYYFKDIDGYPGTYSFGYEISDPGTDNIQFRREERYPNGTVIGSYGYVDATGRPYRFSYIADQKGYRVFQDLPKKSSRKPANSSPSYNNYTDKSNPTESSVTWTRPSKKKTKNDNNNINFKAENRITNLKQLNDPKNYINSYLNSVRY